MTIESVRQMCRVLPGVTEDIKWGNDLVFSVGGKMFAVVCLEPPHTVAFKCTPEGFAELVERDGIIPAPYLARAMWVQDQQIGDALDRRELEQLLATSHALVSAKLPKSRRPGATKPGPRLRSGRGKKRQPTARRVQKLQRSRKKSR